MTAPPRWIPRLPTARSKRVSVTSGIVLLLLYVGLLIAYFFDGSGGVFDPDRYDADPPAGGVLVSLTTRSVDPINQTMTLQLRLELDPSLEASGYAAGFGTQTPGRAITVSLISSNGVEPIDQLDFVYAKGEAAVSRPVTLLFTGHIRGWPFDIYRNHLMVFASAGDTALPVDVSLGGSVQNWSLAATPGDGTSGAGAANAAEVKARSYDLSFDRALGTILFGIAVVLVLLTLPVLGLFVALACYRGRRRLQPAFLGWIAALLFATVPLRNFLPGSPPPGSWVDVAVVLWVLIGLTVALVFGVRVWWRDSDPPDIAGDTPVSTEAAGPPDPTPDSPVRTTESTDQR